MATHFDTLPIARFAEVAFPWESLTYSASLRHHVHVYRKTPGGQIEKQGRSLYRFRFAAVFDTTIKAAAYNQGFPLYPDGLRRLRRIFENKETTELVVPTMGTIIACLISFEASATPATSRSGERVTLEFLEDQTSAFAIDAIDVEGKVASLDSAYEYFGTLVAAIPAADLPDFAIPGGDRTKGIFEKIDDAIDLVRGVIGETQIYAYLVEAKILRVASLCEEAERNIRALQDPLNWRILEALRVLRASAVSFAKTIAGAQETTIGLYTTPRQMTVQQVAIAVYGRTSSTTDVLNFNNFRDPMAIAAGTPVKFLRDLAA